MKPSIYVTQPIPDKVFQLLAPLAELEINPDAAHIPTKQELLDGVLRNDILFSRLSDVIDADVIRANPRLKLIASMAIAPSAIDIPAATARGIPISTVPPITTEGAMAMLAISFISEEETGADHCQHDNPTIGQEYMTDWLVDRFGIDEKAQLGQVLRPIF